MEIKVRLYCVLVFAVLFTVFFSVFVGSQEAFAVPSVIDPNFEVETVTSDLAGRITTMAFLGPDDILVLQKNDGKVMRVLNDELQDNPVLDVPVANNKEEGLLGIVIVQSNPSIFVYLYFTEAESDGGDAIANRVYRYTWNSATGQLESPVLVLDLPVNTDDGHHNGGILVTDLDNEIFAVIGDVDRRGILQNRPPGVADDTSVIIPILDPLHTYTAIGIRNSFGLGVDPITGFLWDTENGLTTFDEINLITSNFNSGWITVMGPSSSPLNPNPPPDPLTVNQNGIDTVYTYSEPEFSWLDTNAPTAITFIDTEPFSNYRDFLFVGDFNAGQIYSFPLNADRDGFDFSLFPALQDLVADNNAERDLLIFGSGFGGISDIKVGPDGVFYVVSLTMRSIFKIIPTDSSGDDKDMDGIPDDIDNCPDIANPGQEDFDGDGIGDVCDTFCDKDYSTFAAVHDNRGGAQTTLDGDGTNELFFAGDNGDTIFGRGGNDCILGGAGADTIQGNGGKDQIFGFGGDDDIRSGIQDDIIWAGDGNDFVSAGDGNDIIHGEDGDDTLDGNKGDDTMYGEGGIDLMRGRAGVDTMHGGGGNDNMLGNPGNDYIHGGFGLDTLYGGEGDDLILGAAGDDTIYGGPDNDTLHGNTGNDSIFGGDGMDFIIGQAGNDILHGGDGDDIIDGRPGNDVIFGEKGNDSLNGRSGDDMVFGGEGNDVIIDYGPGMDHLEGGPGNDEVRGGNGNDEVLGNDGDDLLYGNRGDDLLDGGLGIDELRGGPDNDTCLTDSNDTVISSCEF